MVSTDSLIFENWWSRVRTRVGWVLEISGKPLLGIKVDTHGYKKVDYLVLVYKCDYPKIKWVQLLFIIMVLNFNKKIKSFPITAGVFAGSFMKHDDSLTF